MKKLLVIAILGMGCDKTPPAKAIEVCLEACKTVGLPMKSYYEGFGEVRCTCAGN